MTKKELIKKTNKICKPFGEEIMIIWICRRGRGDWGVSIHTEDKDIIIEDISMCDRYHHGGARCAKLKIFGKAATIKNLLDTCEGLQEYE